MHTSPAEVFAGGEQCVGEAGGGLDDAQPLLTDGKILNLGGV
ncbi:hypothetical protein [uncultured Mobiluncus sp.]|nr:hypothetical protein [uncultured Mobiluncus sp.]